MAGIDIYKSWKSFINSSEGAAIITFITTKNSKEIGAWLKRLGAVMAEGKKGAVAKMLLGTGIKLAGVGVAAYIAYKEVKRQWDETKKIWNKDDITGFEKIARIALEAHPVTMTIRSIKSGWDWLTKSEKQRKTTYSATGAVKAMPAVKTPLPMPGASDKANRNYEFGSATAEYEKNKVVNKHTPLKTTSDQLSEYLGRRGGSDMKKTEKKIFNGPEWYLQGLASKLLGTNLTWSGVKDHTHSFNFVSAATLWVSLPLATDRDKKLHPQIIANTNIEWQALRGKNTGAFNYSEEDVFTYDFALMAMIAVYRFTGKLISLSNVYNPEVESLPQSLLAGFANNMVTNVNTGVTMYKDICANKSLYITKLNSIGKQINAYALKGRTLISRWNYIADKCIKDYNGDKAIYGFYALKWIPSLTASGIDMFDMPVSLQTIPALLAYLDSQLDLFRTYKSGVLLKVAGDMIKLLGAGGETFANVPYFTGIEVPSFEYDPEAFDQIRNAKMIPFNWSQTPSFDRTTPSKVTTTVTAAGGAAALADTNFYAFDSEYIISTDRNKELKSSENIQMTQFYYSAENNGASISGGFEAQITECGFTLLDHMSIMTYDSNGDPSVDNYSGIVTVYNGTSVSQEITLSGVISSVHGVASNWYQGWLGTIAQIDFMPRIQLCLATASESKFLNRMFDIDQYAYITDRQFSQFNNVAVYSLTYVFNPEDVKITGLLTN